LGAGEEETPAADPITKATSTAQGIFFDREGIRRFLALGVMERNRLKMRKKVEALWQKGVKGTSRSKRRSKSKIRRKRKIRIKIKITTSEHLCALARGLVRAAEEAASGSWSCLWSSSYSCSYSYSYSYS
jgi:hypothetical protein